MGRPKGSKKPQRAFSDAEIRRMVARRADGVTLTDIARGFQTSATTVKKLVRAATAAPVGQ